MFKILFFILWLAASVQGCMEALDKDMEPFDKIGIAILIFFIGWTLVCALWILDILVWLFKKLDEKQKEWHDICNKHKKNREIL